MARDTQKKRRRTGAVSDGGERIGLYLSSNTVKQLDELIQKLNIGLSAVVSIAVARFHSEEPLVRTPKIPSSVPTLKRKRKRGSIQTIPFDLENSDDIDTTRVSNT